MRRLLLVLVAVCCGACSHTSDDAKPVATPSVTLREPGAAIESPIDVTYQFVVAADAPALTKDYTVFVHFNDRAGAQLWTDDHQPSTPTSQWKPGETIRYTRTMFVPKVSYTGPASIDIGLYLPGTDERVPLAGETTGQRAYPVGSLDVRPQEGNTIVFYKTGWYDPENAATSAGVEWRWSKNEAAFEFRNPKRDVVFTVDLDQPERHVSPAQRVDLKDPAGMTVDSFTLEPGQRKIRRVALTPAQLGAGDTVLLTLAVDRTFSPAYLPSATSTDVRTLGVRVFHAVVQPK
jgi:hypothetical protein